MRPSRIAAGVMFCALALPGVRAGAAASAWDKVHPRVVQELAAHGRAEALVVLEEQAGPISAPARATREVRGRAVFDRLTAVAERSQRPLRRWLAERGIDHRPFWIANMIWVEADELTIERIASREDVARVDANPRVRLALPEPAGDEGASDWYGGPEWGVALIGADAVWSAGFDGAGVVVAGQDTGYDWDHEALIDSYRGWNGSTAQHDYNWHDAIHVGGGSCPGDSPIPCFDLSHGTHTMGTMVGSNLIGVAPGAEWIACRNMDSGDGTAASYSECFEFFLAPTDSAGNNPDPTLAPHVINNSWYCPPEEGCDFDTLRTVVENVRAAGIVVVASAGNDGSSCETIEYPPALYEASFSVGATDDSDDIAQFSSRGPVTVDGSDRLKPDVAAPGVSVRSSTPDDGYGFSSGTSMAGPHVAGLVALLLDARPDLIGRVDEIEELIRRSAVPLTTDQDCGGISGDEIPNPVFGHGRIDAYETIFGDADGDGSDNLTDCAPVDETAWIPPAPVSDLAVGDDGATTFVWGAAPQIGEGSVIYDLLRSEQAQDFGSADCVASGLGATQATDDALPPDGIYFYLVRAVNGCGSALGPPERSAADCP